LGGTDSFAEFTGNAAFFTSRVAAKGVLATETRGDGAFFEGVVDCVSGAGMPWLAFGCSRVFMDRFNRLSLAMHILLNGLYLTVV